MGLLTNNKTPLDDLTEGCGEGCFEIFEWAEKADRAGAKGVGNFLRTIGLGLGVAFLIGMLLSSQSVNEPYTGGGGAQQRVSVPTPVSPANRPPPSISRAQCQSIVADARKEHGRMWKDSIRDPAVQKSCEKEIQQAQSEFATRDTTSCLNAISLAKARTPNGREWRHYLPKSVAEECGIQTPQDTMSSQSSLDTGEPHDVMCRRVIDTSRQRFGVRWVHHIHQVRIQQCRAEIVSQIQYDRERCRHSTTCDVSALPTESDVPN